MTHAWAWARDRRSRSPARPLGPCAPTSWTACCRDTGTCSNASSKIQTYRAGTHTIHIPAGYTKIYAQLCGGAGGGAAVRERDSGRHGGDGGEDTGLYRNSAHVACGEQGRGGDGASDGSEDEGDDGDTDGSSFGWPSSWGNDLSEPQGSERGSWNDDEDGEDGDDGRARITLT